VAREVLRDRAVDVGARHAGPERVERHLLRGDDVLVQPALLVGRRPDHHAALELGVVAPDGRGRLGDEHVARLEDDVVRDGVGPGAPPADLAAVARGRAVLRPELAGVLRPERREHGQGRLVAGPQARLGLGRPRHRVLLEQPVRVLAPAGAQPDQLDLGGALPRHRGLDRAGERCDRRPRHLGEGRALAAEDARVAVRVGADPVANAQVGERAGQDRHRVLLARVLGVRLDPVEGRLLPGALDLELRDEDRRLALDGLRERDRPLVREEAEPRQVLDVRLVEDDDAGRALAARVVEEPLAPPGELCCGDSGRLHGADDIGRSLPARRLNSRRGRASFRAMSHIRVEPGTPTAVGLLEREGELGLLADRLAEVVESGRGRVALIRGEAGVGKTALIRAFCDDLDGATTVLRGACDPLFTPRPLGPLLDIAELVGGQLVDLVEYGAKPYEVVSALADELGDRGPVVVVLEDLHWADEATLDVFRLLVRRVESVPVVFVASYRDDGIDAADPLRIVLGELATTPSISRIGLTPLSASAVAELAEPYGADAAELYDKTGGNPFFVVEALAAGSDAIPDTVRDAVLARAARLGPAARSVLEAVAVVPPAAELWLLEQIGDGDAAGLDECLATGMLRSGPAGVAFRHELARLAVEDSVAPQRKLELHRAALAALAEPRNVAPDLARLAHHAEAAGDGDAALRFAPAAAARAEALGAHREAAAQYRRALRFGGSLSAEARADLLERQSRASYLADDIDDAIQAIEQALDLRRELGQQLEEGE